MKEPFEIAVHSRVNRLLMMLLLCAACNTPTASGADAGTGLRIQVLPLQHAQAADVAKMLRGAARPASAGGCKVAVHAQQNAVVLSGTAAQIQEASRVVAQLDAGPGR